MQDLRIVDGVVAAIGAGLEAEGLERVDLDGREVLRGLWDEHVHVTQAALAGEWTPLGGLDSAAAVLTAVRTAAAATAPGDPVIGFGFQDGLWPDRPTLAALDRAARGRVAVLVSHDVHTVWVSSAAAERFGVLPGADGLLREAPAFALGREANRLTEHRTGEAVVSLMRSASRLGVVGVVDFEMTWSRDVWLERMADGWSGPRIEAAVYPADLDRAIDRGGGTGDPVPEAAGSLTVGPLKALVDGSLNTRTAYCLDPYADGGRGILTMDGQELRALLTRGARAGLAPAIHAIGDAAVGMVLDAYEATGMRGRIEHAQLIADTDLPRFTELGVTASVQPGHLLDDRRVAAEHWPGRTHRAYRFRDLLDAGAAMAFGSDAPVARLDPWLALRAAVDRAQPGEEPWHPDQRIPLAAALAASTRGRPVPHPGDPADLIALDAPVEALTGSVAATIVAGRFTHRAL